MKLWTLSDLHLDYNRRYSFELPDPRPEHDIVILAGDICEGVENAVQWIVENELNAKPVVFVPGNHEFYCRDHDHTLQAGLEAAAKHANIHILDNASMIFGLGPHDAVRVSGATLWTDYRYLGGDRREDSMRLAGALLNDHRLIRHGKRLWQTGDCVKAFETSKDFLIRALAMARSEKLNQVIGAHVVVTHHAISRMSVSKQYKDDALTPAFASIMDDMVECADWWIHGHVHHQTRYRIGECTVIVNSRGYLRLNEDRDFDPGLVLDTRAKREAKRKRRAA